MPGVKPNSMLARYEARAKAEAKAEYELQLDLHGQIDLAAHLISAHEDLGVGPGRAERVLNGFLESKMDVVEAINAECDSDDKGECVKTLRDLAVLLKRILGPANWDKYKYMFPVLKDWWNLV